MVQLNNPDDMNPWLREPYLPTCGITECTLCQEKLYSDKNYRKVALFAYAHLAEEQSDRITDKGELLPNYDIPVKLYICDDCLLLFIDLKQRMINDRLKKELELCQNSL